MKAVLINRCRTNRMPRAFLLSWIKKLAKQKPFSKIQEDVVIVFVDVKEMRALNKQFRGRDYATDVLSFAPSERGVLGELVLCPQVLKKQAKDSGLTYQFELGFMVVHGSLHLLGFDHEKSKAKANQMFALQDRIFKALSAKF